MNVIERWMAETAKREEAVQDRLDTDERLAEYADAVTRLREEAGRVWAALQRERGAVEDRDKLAAYVAWKFAPHGEAPTTFDDLRALMARLGHTIPGGQ